MMTTHPADVTSLATANLWCKEGTHDKLYRLEIMRQGDRFDVLSAYGRRGGRMTLHVWADGVSQVEAKNVFSRLLMEKRRKGYREIHEDAMVVGKTIPTRF